MAMLWSCNHSKMYLPHFQEHSIPLLVRRAHWAAVGAWLLVKGFFLVGVDVAAADSECIQAVV